MLETTNKMGETPLGIMRTNIDKIRKMKPGLISEVTTESIQRYMRNPDDMPFVIETGHRRNGEDQGRKPTNIGHHQDALKHHQRNDSIKSKSMDDEEMGEDEKSFLKERKVGGAVDEGLKERKE